MPAPHCNLTPPGVRLRLTSGLISLLVGIAAGAGLLYFGAERPWRLALFIPFWSAALGLLQARERT